MPREVAEWWRKRDALRCEEERNGDVVVTGPGAEDATVAYVSAVGDAVSYEVDG